MKQTRLRFQREFCSVHARNISLFSLGFCGYFYVTLDHKSGFLDCYFWGAIIVIPKNICFLFLPAAVFCFLLLFWDNKVAFSSFAAGSAWGEGDLGIKVCTLPPCLSQPYVILPVLYWFPRHTQRGECNAHSSVERTRGVGSCVWKHQDSWPGSSYQVWGWLTEWRPVG